jgi:hypothetical protein
VLSAEDLTPLLQRLGIDEALAPPIATPQGAVLRLRVPGARAVERWKLLRSLLPTSGRAPLVVVGISDEDLIEAIERGTAELTVTLERAESIDVDRWLAGRYDDADGDAEAHDDPFGDDIDDRAALAEAFGIDPERLPEIDLDAQLEFSLPRQILGNDHVESVQILLLPTEHGWQAPAYLGFGGWNELPWPAELAAALARWRERYGAEPFGVSGDRLELAVSRPPSDDEGVRTLADQLYAFCPDLVDQGFLSRARLARALRGAEIWSFWWD